MPTSSKMVKHMHNLVGMTAATDYKSNMISDIFAGHQIETLNAHAPLYGGGGTASVFAFLQTTRSKGQGRNANGWSLQGYSV